MFITIWGMQKKLRCAHPPIFSCVCHCLVVHAPPSPTPSSLSLLPGSLLDKAPGLTVVAGSSPSCYGLNCLAMVARWRCGSVVLWLPGGGHGSAAAEERVFLWWRCPCHCCLELWACSAHLGVDGPTVLWW
jgi:hypothetical protein